MASNEIAASLRIRAELARRLAGEIVEPNAAKALTEMADALDEEAAELEHNVVDIRPMLRDD